MAEVALEIVHVRLAVLSTMRPEFRMLPLMPSIDAEGRRKARIGRSIQHQWFEAVLLDGMDHSAISREACELCWGGPDAAQAQLQLCVLGQGVMLVDDTVIAKGDSVLLRPGSRISLARQVGPAGELETIMSLAVHCAGFGQLAPQGQQAFAPTPPEFLSVPEERESLKLLSAEAPDVWRLECVFAAGLAPEAFSRLPLCARQMSLQLAVGSTPKVIGREHQPELFGALLGHDPNLHTSISRNAFRLEPPNVEAGGVRVTNLSINVAVVAQRPLQQGESTQVLDGDTLSFAQCVPSEVADEAASHVPYLTFRLMGPPPPSPPTPFAMLSLPSLSIAQPRKPEALDRPEEMQAVPWEQAEVPIEEDLVHNPSESMQEGSAAAVPPATSPILKRPIDFSGGSKQDLGRGTHGAGGVTSPSTAPLARASGPIKSAPLNNSADNCVTM